MTRRTLVEFVCVDEIPSGPVDLPLQPTPSEARLLSGDPAAGDGAAIVDLPTGWHGRVTAPDHAGVELVVLSGEVVAGTTGLGVGGYLAVSPSVSSELLACPHPARIFVGASPHVDADAFVPPSEEGWSRPSVPGPAEGLTHKCLRGEPGPGPSAFLLRVPAGWSEPRTEWHECAEECVVLDGDLWHDRANGGAGGTMTRHCYFWRPPFVLHSPMGSHHGVSMFMTTDGPLVNHYLDEHGPPPRSTGGRAGG